MTDEPVVVKSVFGNRLIVFMVILLCVMITGFAGRYFLVNLETQRKGYYIGYANQLKVLSQEIAKHAASAALGNIAIFPLLTDAKDQFEFKLAYLKKGNSAISLPPSPAASLEELNKISALWVEMTTYIDLILKNQEALVHLRDISADLSITMSAIQAENKKVVASMLRLSSPANVVALAQQQAYLIERISHGIDNILQAGSSKTLSDDLISDSQKFNLVLGGLTNGNKKLLLTAASNSGIRSSLTKIEELYRSVLSTVNEVSIRSGELEKIQISADATYALTADFLAASDALIESYVGVIGEGLPPAILELVFAGGTILLILVIIFLAHWEGKKSSEEIGRTVEQNQAAILLLLDELADMADGDLSVRATVTDSFTGAIADSINFSFDQMRGLVKKIIDTSAKVTKIAAKTQSSVGELAEASQRQSNEIGDVSTAVDEIAVSINMVSYNAAESSSVAERSVDIANKGAIVVQNTIDGMDNIRGQIQETAKRIKRLGESSQEIGDIVALINDIADQTNILSLNAAIQASMAGDAGKGFAVVADEVQRLAERSGAAAKQISALVKTIQSDTNEAVSSMEETTAEVVQGTQLAQDAGVALGEIEGVSKSLAEIIEKIFEAARKQAASTGNISDTMKSIQKISSQTTEGVRSTAKAVGGLAGLTNELRTSVTRFKIPE